MRRRLWMLLAVLTLILPASGVRGGENAAVQGASAASSTAPASVEERRLKLSLQEELGQLRQREENLRRREMELKTLEAEVDKKLAEMKKLREELAIALSQKDEGENLKVRDLGKMYEKMEPGRAALLLADLDEQLAVEILGSMKKKAAGKVLGSMEKEKAARLSEAYPQLGAR